MSEIQFLFESDSHGGYVDILANSACVSGAIVSQNAGSSNPGLYYQVGGGGLNGAFASALGSTCDATNAALQTAYDAKFGAGSWAQHRASPPEPAPLTSLLIPLSPSARVGDRVAGMMYSVGPVLTRAGLTPALRDTYTQVYADAMHEIARSPTRIAGLRVTLLSSGIYSGGAPIAELSEVAAGCIIDAACAAVAPRPAALGQLTILINTDTKGSFSKEREGFTRAATARGAAVSSAGFRMPVCAP